MGRLKTTAAIVTVTLLFGIAGRMDKEDAERVQTSNVPTSQEDDPFFDCSAQGNFSCNWPIHGMFPPR